MDLEEAFARLRLAARLYNQTKPPPEHAANIARREAEAWSASEAGVSDSAIARIYGIPRENVKRMRQRYARKRGWAIPPAVTARGNGGVEKAREMRERRSQEPELT